MRLVFGIAIGTLVLAALPAQARQSATPPQAAELTPVQRQIAAQLAAPKLDAQATVAALDLTATPLRDVLDAVAKAAGITLRYDSAVTTALDVPVAVKLSNTRAEDALHLVLDSHGLAFKATSARSAVIYPDTPAGRGRYTESVRTFTIVNADVSMLIQTLNQLLTPLTPPGADGLRPVIVMDREARTIIARATADKMAEIAKLIAANDKR